MLHGFAIMMLSYITLLVALSSTALASPISARELSASFAYQSAVSSCPVLGYKRCNELTSPFDSRIFSNTSFPPDFCCPNTTTCQSADNGSTLICCPNGRNCSVIEAINCDINLQNATAVPKSVIKTTRLNDDLPKCGDACCPFGYGCTDEGYCRVLHSQESGSDSGNGTTTAVPSGTITTNATTLAAPIVPSRTGTSEASSPAKKNKDGTDDDDDDDYPGRAVGLGFGLGTLAGVILALSLISCLHCFQKSKQKKADNSPSNGKLYTPALKGGSNDRVIISPRNPHLSSFQQKHRRQSAPVAQNPFSKEYTKPNSVNSNSYERSLTPSVTVSSDPDSARSRSTASKQPSPIASDRVPRRTSSMKNSNPSIHREGTRDSRNSNNHNTNNSGGQGSSGVPNHMGHEVLFRPRNMGVSLDTYDTEAWTRSVGRRSEQGPSRNSAESGRWRPCSGGHLPPGTGGTSWTDVIDAAKEGK
ncbi:hypothetical protein KEM56_000051 [Ascosphaera pollenicola]|nr:hypothetical protein KEM56_000051 [Ascosphaera pollenicola]